MLDRAPSILDTNLHPSFLPSCYGSGPNPATVGSGPLMLLIRSSPRAGMHSVRPESLTASLDILGETSMYIYIDRSLLLITFG